MAAASAKKFGKSRKYTAKEAAGLASRAWRALSPNQQSAVRGWRAWKGSETKKKKARKNASLVRDAFAEPFRDEGVWRPIAGGRGEGVIARKVDGGRTKAKDVLANLEINTIDAIRMSSDAWVSVGVQVEPMSGRALSIEDRYDRYAGKKTIWSNARLSRFTGYAYTVANDLIDKAYNSRLKVTGVLVRTAYGSPVKPKHWKGRKRREKR